VDVYAHQEALACYDRALALLARGDARCAEFLVRRGQSLRFLGCYDEAISACRQVVEAAVAPWAAEAAGELAGIYRTRRSYDQARAWVEAARRLAQGIDAPDLLHEEAHTCQRLAGIEREQGNLDAAQVLFEQALALCRQLDDRQGEARCQSGLGHLDCDREQYAAAQGRFEQALPLFQVVGDRPNEADCLRALGHTHWRQGAYDAAQSAIRRGLEICRAIGDRQGEAACLNDLGLVHIIQGDRTATRRYWEESMTLYRVLGLEKRTASSLHNLGILYVDLGAYDDAERCLEEALALTEAIGAKPSQALNLGWLGNLHLQRGDYDPACRCLEAALDLGRQMGGGREESWHWLWRGAVAFESRDLGQARSILEQAVERGTGAKFHEAYHWLAATCLAQGDGEAALSHGRRNVAEADRFQGAVHTFGVSYITLATVLGSGLIDTEEDPLPHFERGLLLLRQDDLPFFRGVALRRYGACLLRAGDEERGQAHLRAARVVLTGIGARGELDKVVRLLAGDDAPWLQW
jgi:tetratricopeptide (TPR) repeat protein